MAIRFHRVAAVVVLAVAGAWVATGHFSSVGSSAEPETTTAAKAPEAPQATAAKLRTVGVMTPVFTQHAREIRISGLTSADKSTMLAARTAGVVSKIGVTKGESVVEGAQVLVIEGPEVEANVATARTALEQSMRELDIAEALFKRGSSSETRVTAARTGKAAAEAQLSQAVAAQDRLQTKAPFSGVVESVELEVGEFAQPGAPAARLVALDPIVVRADVSELDLRNVAVGGTAKVRLVTGEVMDGTIRNIAHEASGPTRTFPTEVALPNPDLTIPAGMTAEVSIYAAPQTAVAVPRSVITLSPQGEIGIRVVTPKNTALFVPVSVIDDTPEGLVITGVPRDTRIIIAGQDLVADGEQVYAVATNAQDMPAGAMQ